MILFSCRRVAEISSKELDARLKLTELVCAGAHRRMCAPCRRYRAQLRAVDRAARELVRQAPDAGDEHLPAKAKARMRVRLAAAEGGDTPTAAGATGRP